MELDSWHSMNMQLIAQEKLFWITPETVVIKNSQEQIFCMPKATFNEIFGKKGKK